MRTKGRRVPIHPTVFRKSMYETISSSPPDLRCLTTTSGVPPRRVLNLTETPFGLLMHTRQLKFDPSRGRASRGAKSGAFLREIGDAGPGAKCAHSAAIAS